MKKYAASFLIGLIVATAISVNAQISQGPITRSNAVLTTLTVGTITGSPGSLTLDAVPGANIFANKTLVLNGIPLQFGPGNGTADLAFSRLGANSAALGNGSANDTSGSMSLGTLLSGDGSAANPSYGFTSVAHDGFWHSSHIVNLSLNGTNYFSFQTNNVVGLALNSAIPIGWSSGDPTIFSPDVLMYRSAAKTLKIDTDGVGGSLTNVLIQAPITTPAGAAITAGGNLAAGSGDSGADAIFWSTRSVMRSPSDGVVSITNQAATGFTRLILGTNDATASGFSWNLNAGNIEAKLGDSSAYGPGIRASFFASDAGGNLANAGSYRLANGGSVQWRNAANSSNVLGMQVDGSNNLVIGDTGVNAITLSKKISSYNAIATAGQGVPTIYSEAISTSQSANVTVLTYTPPATAGRYLVHGVITTTSGTNTGTVQMTVDYKDSQGTVHTADIMALMDAAGTIATTKTGASKEYHTLPWEISINNGATAIVVKVVITGTVAYTAAASVEQIG